MPALRHRSHVINNLRMCAATECINVHGAFYVSVLRWPDAQALPCPLSSHGHHFSMPIVSTYSRLVHLFSGIRIRSARPLPPPPPSCPSINDPGDANGDGRVTTNDSVAFVQVVVSGDESPWALSFRPGSLSAHDFLL